MTPFQAPTAHGDIGGWVDGDGPPVLLVHGGPGLSFEHLEEPAAELLGEFRVASFQQRGLAPSCTEGPFSIDQAVADIEAVLDHLGWPRAYLVGHSYGGHLVLHAAVRLPGRLQGVLSVDPIGVVGDGGGETFGQELRARLSPEARVAADALGDAAQSSPDAALQQLRLLWPGYFADQQRVAPFPVMRLCLEAGAGLWPDMVAAMPALEAALPSIEVPVGFLLGGRSPMPPDQAGLATAALVPGAWSEVLPQAGHFPWFEVPGSLLAAVRRLAAQP